MRLITFFLLVLQILLVSGNQNVDTTQGYSSKEIDDSWIRVPWSSGGHYYHNMLTREDRDDHPPCLSGTCNWEWSNPTCDN